MEDNASVDDEYDAFYKDAVQAVRLIFLYINEQRELIYSKKCILPLENEVITKSQLIYLLKQHAIYNKIKYYPKHLLQYNIGLDTEDVQPFIEEPENYNFMRGVQYLNGIHWKKTIKFFHSLNSLYIIMKERKKTTGGVTKRIFLSTKKRKTRRKYI
jgi:hypothetical protein